jgi:hypothetical protein
MEGTHYLAKEDGRIKAVIGAYPLEMIAPGDTLPGRGIGMVSVHPYCRSRGYMRALMDRALADMRRDGIVWSALGGQRQRYEYFGYTPAGTALSFSCGPENIRHTLGRDFASSRSLRLLSAGDTALLDGIRRMHEAKQARFFRGGGTFFDILSSWKSQVFAVLEGEALAGYLLTTNGRDVTEINLIDVSRMAEVIGLLFNSRLAPSHVRVTAQPFERDKIAALAAFAGGCACAHAYSFAVFDYRRMIAALLKLKLATTAVADGEVTLRIGEGDALRIAVSGGEGSVSPVNEAPSDRTLSMGRLEATRFLFSFTSPFVSPRIAESPFLQSLLPLPLFFEEADGV